MSSVGTINMKFRNSQTFFSKSISNEILVIESMSNEFVNIILNMFSFPVFRNSNNLKTSQVDCKTLCSKLIILFGLKIP